MIIRQRDWHDVKLTRAAKASTCHSDHALLRSKVSISFQLKRQHQRVQRTKKLDVAKLANSETQKIFRDNIASALEDLVDIQYKEAASHLAELRTKLFQASADSLGFGNKKHKGWFDENEASVSSLLNELHSLHIEYINNKDSQAKKDRYSKKKQKVQAKLREMKDKWWCDRTRELQSAADTLRIRYAKKLFSELKTVYGPSSKETSPFFDLDGHTVITEPSLITERWAQHFNQLLNRQSTISEDAIAEVPQRPVIKAIYPLQIR